MPLNLCDIFHQTAARQPEHPAILGPGPAPAWSYRMLAEEIDRAADRLAAAGLQPGECVGLHVPSGRAYIVLTYALWRCGACAVPIPVELTLTEKHEIGREIALDWIISDAADLALAEPFRTDRAPADLGDGRVAVPVSGPRTPPWGFHEVNAAFIRFTSGTTGSSKGVVLSHETIFDRIHAANDALRIGPEDRVVWLLSMSYHFTVSIVGYLTFGATVLLPANTLAAGILDTARRHRGTLIYGAPVHYAWMAGANDAGPLPDLRLAISTAMSLDTDAAEAFHRRFGVPVAQALGLIEIGLPCINLDFAADRCQAVGRVLPAYQLRLADVALGPGLKEICFAGKGILDAYYEPWRTRDEIMPDGWFHTGDVGELDADGCLFIRGRSKDVINVAGMKFFPAEVEAVLKSHPRIREACVFAQPHPRFGEAPHARIVAAGDLTEEDVLDYCQARLAPFKIPVALEFVDALPRTASGKVVRRAVPTPTPRVAPSSR